MRPQPLSWAGRTAWSLRRAGITLCVILSIAAGAAVAHAESLESLVRKGRAEADILWRRGYTLGDSALASRLQGMMDSLTAGDERPDGVALHVHVFRSPERNAFALPDGSIFVFAGLLADFTSSEQLAFVLAHEARHALGAHAKRRIDDASSKSAIFEALSLASALALGGSASTGALLLNDLAQLGLGLSAAAAISGYGRELEREADMAAVEGLQSTGRDACGAVEAIAVLQARNREQGRVSNFFWGSHPRLTARAEYLQEAAGADTCTFDSTLVTASYASIKWPMVVMSAQLWVAADEREQALRLANAYVAEFPDDAGIHTVLGDAYGLSYDPDTLDLAVHEYERAWDLAPDDDRLPLRGLALVAEKRADTTACIAYLERYLADDAPVHDRRAMRRKLETMKQLWTDQSATHEAPRGGEREPMEGTQQAAPSDTTRMKED